MAAIFGTLLAFRVPVGVIIKFAVAILTILAACKFLHDNYKLYRDNQDLHFWQSFFVAIAFMLLFAIPIAIPWYIAGAIGSTSDFIIGVIDNIAAPETITQKLQFPEPYVPWYYKPAEWLGYGATFSKIKMTEREVQITRKAPLLFRIISGAIRTPLLLLSLVSYFYSVILGLRTFSSLFTWSLSSRKEKPSFSVGPKQIKLEPLVTSEYIPSSNVRNVPLFFNRDVDISGHVPDVHWRWSQGCLFKRLACRFVATNKITPSNDPLDIVVSGSPKDHFIELGLSEGQEVALKFESVIGHSGKIKFSRRWNLSMIRIGLRQTSIIVAKGPGVVILKSPGRPAMYKYSGECPSINPDRLIMWDGGGNVEVHSSRGLRNYFFSPYHIKPTSGCMFIHRPPRDETEGKTRANAKSIWKFLFSF